MATLDGAENGDVGMQMLLGQMLVAGYGTSKDVKEVCIFCFYHHYSTLLYFGDWEHHCVVLPRI